MLNVQNMTGCSEMEKKSQSLQRRKISITKFVTDLKSLIGMYCQNPIYPIYIRMFYNDNYIYYITISVLSSSRCGGEQKRPKLENSFEEKLLHRRN